MDRAQKALQRGQWMQDPVNAACLLFTPQQPLRLITLLDDLAAAAAGSSLGSADILGDMVAANLGRIPYLSAAISSSIKLCGSTAAQFEQYTYSCPQLAASEAPNSAGWSADCTSAVGSVCSAACSADAQGTGYKAECVLRGDAAGWDVSGACQSEWRPNIRGKLPHMLVSLSISSFKPYRQCCRCAFIGCS